MSTNFRKIKVLLGIVIKMVISYACFFTGITTGGTTDTSHLVAAIFFDKSLATPMAFAHDCFRYVVLYVDPHVSFGLLFNFIASQGNVVRFLAQPGDRQTQPLKQKKLNVLCLI
jgi:hypothetical protein